MTEIPSEAAVRNPAEIYDERFVPALFEPWARRIADWTVAPGQRVLDVACGTGALTCAAADRAGAGGSVVGLDPNPDMLAVARRKRGDIAWRAGAAESLPFDDAEFDAVVSQFGMMFFDDKARALGEMMRVLKPGGRLAVAVCDAVERSPGYAALAALLERLFGSAVADAFRAPFALGDPALLRTLCEQAGIRRAEVSRHDGTVGFASIADMVSTERACVWTLGGMLDGAQFERLLDESQSALRPFTTAGGRVEFSMPALVITARRQ